MSVINPAFTTAIAAQRPTVDFGEETFTDLPMFQAVISTAVSSKEATLFCPRGTDLEGGDRFTYQGRQWRVAGWKSGDCDHPVTGDDFGWMAYRIEAAT